MRKIVVLSFISLDGVMQAPGGSEEDRAEGFKFGGWTFPYFDEESGKLMDQQISGEFDLLLGRKTYDIFAPYWPAQDEKTNPVAGPFNKAKKYVVSNGSPELSWENSELITGDVVARLKELKESDGPVLQVHGSSKLVQTLLQNDLVDELWLKTFPVILGKGKRLFDDAAVPHTWELTYSLVTPSGVIFANYTRGGDVKTGSFV
jgi:dihydrofolate reductase